MHTPQAHARVALPTPINTHIPPHLTPPHPAPLSPAPACVAHSGPCLLYTRTLGVACSGRIAEDRASCDLIAKEEIAIQQLVLMALSDNQVVVRQACKTIGHLATSSKDAVGKLVANDVLSAVTTLIKSFNQESQLCGLRLLSALAAASDSVSANLLHPLHITRLHQLIRIGGSGIRVGGAGSWVP